MSASVAKASRKRRSSTGDGSICDSAPKKRRAGVIGEVLELGDPRPGRRRASVE
jgi:hypothetical protein